MGGDLLCKLHASIHCTPDGLYLTIPEDKAVQAMQFLQSTVDQLYCWTLSNFQMRDTFTVSNIQKIAKISPICATLMSAMRPLLRCECTAAFNPSQELIRLAGIHLDKKEKLECEQILFVGPEGSALPMLLTERQSELFDDNDSCPLIAVAVTPGHEARELGKMVARCQTLRASNEGSPSQMVTTLGYDLYMINMSARIELPDSTFIVQQLPLETEYGPPSELAEVPAILWARHKNHVGFVNSAPPHRVTLKANAKLPMIR